MSVIIKGMEMPKYCSDCPLLDGETGRCNILKITVCDYIPKACPLVEVVQCNDCKHRPVDTGGHGDGFDMEFPDNVCPCQVEDPYYSWVPKDDWFCPDGERKDNGRREL